ncbi:Zonular occludens toxin (Zot) [compost metagenome]
MALNGYFGKPGSGKSYSVVEYVVIPALKKGRHVVTNIPLEEELLTQVFGGKITQLPLDALDDPDLPKLIPHGAVAVIDECWRRWPSGQKVNKAHVDDLQWLKEHRHRVDGDGNAMQVVLVTQDPADLASWVRKLIAHSFHMHKLEEIGAAKRFGIKVYKGCPTGERIPAKLMIREAYGTYKPDIYQYYRSATQSQTLDVGDEKAMDKRTSVWSSGQMLVIMLFVPLAVIGGGYLGYNYVATKLHPKGEEPPPLVAAASPVADPALVNPMPPELLPVASAASQVPSLPVQSSVPAVPAQPIPSGMWRIAGYIRRGDQERKADDPASWPSNVGYGEHPPETVRLKMQAQAILVSLSGVRYFPLDRCTAYEDGINYYCDIDGERVTPWTGKLGLTNTFQSTAGANPQAERAERSDARPAKESSKATL